MCRTTGQKGNCNPVNVVSLSCWLWCLSGTKLSAEPHSGLPGDERKFYLIVKHNCCLFVCFSHPASSDMDLLSDSDVLGLQTSIMLNFSDCGFWCLGRSDADSLRERLWVQFCALSLCLLGLPATLHTSRHACTVKWKLWCCTTLMSRP